MVSIVSHTYICRMRKEINLDEQVIEWLQLLADRKEWSLKKYMEAILKKESIKALKLPIKNNTTKQQ